MAKVSLANILAKFRYAVQTKTYLDVDVVRHFGKKKRKSILLKVKWNSTDRPEQKTSVRVSRIAGTNSAILLSVSSLPLGMTTLPKNVKGNYFRGRVLADTQTVHIVARMRKNN